MALLRSIIAREIAVKKRTDDIRILIPLHIIASLPLANKMTTTEKTKKKKKTEKKTTGRRSGKGNYLPEETMFLLDILQRVRPIGPEEWQQCADDHTAKYRGRNVESIRRKFSDLYRKSIPTGDPNCPEDVKRAKHIKWSIGDRACVGDGEEEFNLEDSSFTAKADPDAPPAVADPPLGDDDSDGSDDEPVAAPPALAPPPVRRRTPTPAKRAYRGRDDSKVNFVQLMQMNMLQQQQERAEDRKERAADRQQMTAMMMAMMSGRQLPPPVAPPVPPVPPPPPIELDCSSNSDGSNSDSDSDSDLEAAFKVQKQALDALLPKKRTPVAPPVVTGVTTRFHKKKRGLGNSSSSNVEVSDFI